MSPERVLAPLGRRRVEVSGHERLGAYDVIACADPDGPLPQPGQFYMLAAVSRWGAGEGERPFLPRAFSVARAAPGRLEFLLEDVGPGTARLCELRPGDGLWLLGPLGRGFTAPAGAARHVLCGGGVGIAPLAILADELRAAGGEPAVLLGFRDAPHARGAAYIEGALVATDDGSSGHHGLVTELLARELDRGDEAEVCACGPPPMLEAVRALCAERGVRVELALESGMACGFGACFGCVVPTRGGYVRLCVDGPVLEGERLDTCLVPGAGH